MQQDGRLRVAACQIYDACYPSDDWSPLPFEEAERFETIHYRQAIETAQRALSTLTALQP